MHSSTSRLNSILLFTGSVLAFMCCVNFLHGYILYDPKPDIHFQMGEIINFVKTPSMGDWLLFRYSMTANLTSLYNWNLKQLFAYIEVEWVDPKSHLKSRAIVSDWILTLPEDKKDLARNFTIVVQNQYPEYPLRDIHSGLKGTQITISLNVEYMPIVGAFFKTRLYNETLRLPDNYIKQ